MKYKKVTELSKEEILGLIYSINNWDLGYDEEFKNREVIVVGYHNYNTLGIFIDIEVKYTENKDNEWFESVDKEYSCILYNDYSITIQWYDEVVPVSILELAEYINNNLKVKENGKDVTKDLGIVGHFDYSKDGNNNGTIEKWERVKECPSFDVIGSDIHYLYSSEDRYNKLPTEK
jgi:hypothetical protein